MRWLNDPLSLNFLGTRDMRYSSMGLEFFDLFNSKWKAAKVAKLVFSTKVSKKLKINFYKCGDGGSVLTWRGEISSITNLAQSTVVAL